jgi:hypothetical protein
MLKLKKILNEILHTYSVEAFLRSDRKFPITDILNQIRAIRKITIVNNITPDDYPQKKEIETTKIRIKFVTRGDASKDIVKFKEDMITSDLETTDLRIPGIKLVDFKSDTLKRIE